VQHAGHPALSAPPLVLLPAYNEEATVGAVVRAVRLLGYDAAVVDDGSSDATAREAAAAGAEVLRLPVNLGVGGALCCGFRYAVDRGYHLVVQCDADGQHDPRDIPALLDALVRDDADMVIGTRFARDGSAYAVGAGRRAAMRILAYAASRAAGQPLTDSTSGFRVIRSPLLERFASSYPVEYLGDTVEALIAAGREGFRVTEEPITMSPRAAGVSSASFVASLWYLVRVMIAIGLRLGAKRETRASLPDSHGAVP
jgi:glycosyltransferase involved in cell wall biosynthesis